MKSRTLLSRRIRSFCSAGLLVTILLGGWIACAEVPRAEHPRPDASRENWATLNGEWQFEIDDKGDGESRGLVCGKDLSSRITVPFCPESKLSGVGNTGFMKNVWYRRHFALPESMQGKRVLLHFGAVDYRAWVWINGELLGSHIGGSAAFQFEITPVLRSGDNEVVVRVFDDTASGRQPTGKQTHTVSEGCVYTRTTGIWQPVWLEAVGTSYIESFSIVPDPDSSEILLEVAVNTVKPELKLVAEAIANGKSVGTDTCPASWRNNRLEVRLKKKILWEPGSPFLYDLKLSLYQGREKVDELRSYFGLRRVSIDGRAVLINGKRVFQRLILDQGFYPDGIWTAPSDEALKHDIELSMAAGYNGARLHQKVFEPRFLYWADKLGYLVWGEFPNWGFNFKPENYSGYLNEWTEVLLRDRNHPSIVGWCPFNETWGDAGELQQMVWRETKAIDPTRPVLETSGWSHTIPQPEIVDYHDYNQDPAAFKDWWMDYFNGRRLVLPPRYSAGFSLPPCPADKGLPFMVSEFGGTFWGEKQGGWGYGQGPNGIEEFYTRYAGLVGALLDNPNMFGFCYTQLTDVEQEHNGLYFYDRRPKFDLKRLHAITARQAAYEKNGLVSTTIAAKANEKWQTLLGAAPDGDLCCPWRFTTSKPTDNWTNGNFDDATWQTGRAPFGAELPNVRTAWKTSDIWIRNSFDWNGSGFSRAAIVIFHDEDADIYVNGNKILNRSGFIGGYQIFPVTDTLKKAIKNGQNTIAVHVHQTGGGQFIDLALLVEP